MSRHNFNLSVDYILCLRLYLALSQNKIYPTANITFSELVTHAPAFDAIGDCSSSVTITLLYNSKAKPKYRTFKQTIFGYFYQPVLWNSTSVAIKQSFYVLSMTGARILYDKHTQLKKLTTELNCLRWAAAGHLP